MFFKHLFVFLCLTAVLLSGCGKTPKKNIAFTKEGGLDADVNWQQKKDFDQSVELLNSLESSPCLPETPGAEKLVQTADRLNKWMQDRKPDELWKPDDELSAMETASKKTAQTAEEIAGSLQRLQEDDSTLLIAEIAKVKELLTQLTAETKNVAGICGLSGVANYSKQVEDLQRKFAALEKIPNLNDAAIKAFAKQLTNETNDFKGIAELFEKYAAQLRLDGQFFQLSDVEYLKQCFWMRDTSRWARGDKQVLLDVAVNLFDWTVCNIDLRESLDVQVSQNQTLRMPQMFPWQTMLLGYSTLWDRTTVFLELLRQQRIDAAVLSVPHPQNPKVDLYWAVGVLLDGEMYLFLPGFGLPLPAPDGMIITENGELTFSKVATLSQVLKDDKILRQLDLSDKEKFPITAEMLKQTKFHLFVTPESASLRSKVMETELTSEQNAVLYTNIQEQRRIFTKLAAELIPQSGQFSTLTLWKYPFLTKFEQLTMGTNTNLLMNAFVRPNPKRGDFPLWTGRVLYLKGKISGQESAVTEFQDARIPDREMNEYRNTPEFRNNPLAAALLRDVSLLATFWLGTAS
ncbi:MAG: hypothetical protein LBN39_09140, partial [Planctomycetaceae bacterium]|nr:hypothetical protein [Planctomycetaceae bacterium]